MRRRWLVVWMCGQNMISPCPDGYILIPRWLPPEPITSSSFTVYLPIYISPSHLISFSQHAQFEMIHMVCVRSSLELCFPLNDPEQCHDSLLMISCASLGCCAERIPKASFLCWPAVLISSEGLCGCWRKGSKINPTLANEVRAWRNSCRESAV